MIQTSFSPRLIVIVQIRVNSEIGDDTVNQPMNFTQIMTLFEFRRICINPGDADIHAQVPPQTEQQTVESSGILIPTSISRASTLMTTHVWKAA